MFVRAGVPPASNPLVQKLAAFVAQGPARTEGPPGPLCVPVGGYGAPVMALALGRYDAAAGSTRPDMQLNASAAAPARQVRGGRLCLACQGGALPLRAAAH